MYEEKTSVKAPVLLAVSVSPLSLDGLAKVTSAVLGLLIAFVI